MIWQPDLTNMNTVTLSQIKFEKSRIETIINQMRDGIIGLDDKRNILFLNARRRKTAGHERIF